MPLLFFEVRLNDDILVDDWFWFPNVETARIEAAEIGAEITRETGVENVCIDIKDQDGQLLELPSARLDEEPTA